MANIFFRIQLWDLNSNFHYKRHSEQIHQLKMVLIFLSKRFNQSKHKPKLTLIFKFYLSALSSFLLLFIFYFFPSNLISQNGIISLLYLFMLLWKFVSASRYAFRGKVNLFQNTTQIHKGKLKRKKKKSLLLSFSFIIQYKIIL